MIVSETSQSEVPKSKSATGTGESWRGKTALPKAMVLVPDGVGVRNFVIGKFLHELSRQADVDVLHVIPEKLVPQYQAGLPSNVRFHPMPPFEPSRSVDSLATILGLAHMYQANTTSMQRALNRPVKGSFAARMQVKAKRRLGKLVAKLNAIESVVGMHSRAARKSPEYALYRRMFEANRPDVVFSSNQRPDRVVPAILAARDLKIPTAAFIFSWDNLSSKARISVDFDHFLVWSQHMKDELLHFYPYISPDRVHIVGTPQFDPYGDPAVLWSREEFFAKIGADPSRPLLCFSGGDSFTCPEDPLHVAELMKLVRSGQIKGNPTVLVRPVPVDDGTRYRETLQQYPEILFMQPKWIFADPTHWSGAIPTAEDVQFLANLTHHSDMNINLGSTMTLDFGLHDKPVVNVAFDCSNPPRYGMPVYDYYYSYEHFQPVVEYGASKIARNRDQFAEFVNAYLDNPKLDEEGRRKLTRLHVGIPLGDASRAMSEVLARIATA